MALCSRRAREAPPPPPQLVNRKKPAMLRVLLVAVPDMAGSCATCFGGSCRWRGSTASELGKGTTPQYTAVHCSRAANIGYRVDGNRYSIFMIRMAQNGYPMADEFRVAGGRKEVH